MSKPIDHYGEEKSCATRSKHELLIRYMRIWVGMILMSRKEGDIIYLDTCAGTGLFPSKSKDYVDKSGSPLIGLSVFSEVINDNRFQTSGKKFHALLFEKNTEVFNELIRNLKNSGFPEELYTAHNKDYHKDLDSTLECMKNSFILAFIDPFNIGPIPFSTLRKILTTGKTDALIFFPAMQIQRYQGFLKGKDFKGREKLLGYLDIFFDDIAWREVVADVEDGNMALEKLTQHYMTKIEQIGKYSAQFNLLYTSQNKILYKIIITSKSAEAIAQVKRLFLDIREYQDYLRSEYHGQIKLNFGKEGLVQEDDIDVADMLHRKFVNMTVKGEDIYRWAVLEAGPTVDKNTVGRAITILGRSGRIINPKKSKWKAWDRITFLES